jgi:alginate O-acetyltransferase complex protein AlgI
MLFQSLAFLLFFAPVWLLNWFFANRLRSPLAREWLLTIASAAFYLTWSVPLFALLFGSIAINFVVGKQMRSEPVVAKRWVTFGITAQLVILAVFKYANFGIDAAAALAQRLGFELPHHSLNIILPLGISFYTFQGIGYIIDVYRGKYPAYESFLDFFLYKAYFPQLIAGPIVRGDYFRERLRQLDQPVTLPMVSSGLTLFVSGVFKKAVLADNAAKISDLAFLDPGGLSSLMVLLGVYAFAFQIYFDFSGYTDMARGLGRMLGIDLPINFNLPYLSRGLREFWQRWHISLSTWLRDYLYISLGGSRVSNLITYRNLIITMVLGGLWHGANYTFLIWGAFHGFGLAIEHATLGKSERTIRSPLWNALAIALTFHLVCLGWVFFRADSLDSAIAMLRQLTDWGGYAAFEQLALFKPQNWLFGFIVPALFVFAVEPRVSTNQIDLELRAPLRRAIAFCAMLFLVLLTSGKTNEFIYFQF